MKLVDLNPEFLNAGGPGIYRRNEAGELVPAEPRHGVGVMFDCPCGNKDDDHRCYVPFENPLDGVPYPHEDGHARWLRGGDTFETLTLRPSILRNPARGGCGWHGYITDGEVTSC